MKILLSLLLFSTIALGETVADRKGAVLGDRATMEKDARWIYNDWERGMQQAKLAGKPLLVVLRCIPCLACAGIDASVLNDRDLQPLLDRFVCVRLINANTLDLSLFQVDYDLSFSTVFFNGDGTIYGRYGSWRHQKDSQDKTTAGFRKALEAALMLHKAYPANKAELAGKQGQPLPFKSPLEFPELAGKYTRELDWNGKVVQSCVHCHQVGDAIRSYYRDTTKKVPLEWIYPWPAPETIGLELAADDVAKALRVAEGSAAEQAGLKPGDQILSLNGQPLVSIADVSWVLHRAPNVGSLKATVMRGPVEKEITIQLADGWRKKSDIGRRVGTWPMRAMALGGLFMEDINDEERAKRKLNKDSMALVVKHAGEYGIHGAAKKAGFRKDDVLVEIDGHSERISEGRLIGDLLQKYVPGDKVKAVVLRGEERLEFSLPLQ